MVEISIVVVSWNAKAYVEECLTSLSRQKLNVPAEIILVDNASTDGTPAMVERQFPEVRLIKNSENLGFAKANNIGIRQAQGRYVALINSDVNIPPGCNQAMYDFMEQNPSVGVSGPQMLGRDGRIGRSCMRFPTVWNSLCNALCLNLIFKRNPHFSGMFIPDFDPEKTSPVEVLNGWFLVVRRTALEETGLLDERFFIYGEDIDWSYRFYQAGWPRIYFAGASAVHYGGSSSARAPMRFYVEMYKANFQYWEKHHGWPGVLGYWGTSLLHQVLRFTGYSFVYLLWRGKQIEASFKVRRSATCIGWLVGARSIVKIA